MCQKTALKRDLISKFIFLKKLFLISIHQNDLSWKPNTILSKK